MLYSVFQGFSRFEHMLSWYLSHVRTAADETSLHIFAWADLSIV